jgi:hypothetical protein
MKVMPEQIMIRHNTIAISNKLNPRVLRERSTPLRAGVAFIPTVFTSVIPSPLLTD